MALIMDHGYLGVENIMLLFNTKCHNSVTNGRVSVHTLRFDNDFTILPLIEFD